MQVAAVLMVIVLVLALAASVECTWQRWWGTPLVRMLRWWALSLGYLNGILGAYLWVWRVWGPCTVAGQGPRTLA